MTKDRLFEFLVLLGALEYHLEAFAEKMDHEISLRKMIQENNLN
ncbi:MAG: hypothetical protein AAGU27_08500 [Dehalobacterium sp.]